MKCLLFNGLCHLIGEGHYESNCYSGAQLPLMGVAGLQSTLRSISVHYSMNPHICQILKLCILKNTLKPVSNKRFKISTKAPMHTWCRWHRFLILYKKKDIFQKIMVAEENWEVWKKFWWGPNFNPNFITSYTKAKFLWASHR